MSVVKVDRTSNERSDDLKTLAAVARTYLRSGSPRAMLLAVALSIAARVVVADFGWTDAVIVVAALVLVGFVEWVLHLFLLHAPDDSKRMTKYGTGSGHRRHHLDPNDVGWIMLSWQDATIFIAMFLVWTAVWVLPLALLIGAPLLASYLTGLVISYLGLAHYEWTHLLVHTRYRPRSRRYKRLAANHRLHHFRNEQHWLGVTSNLGDRVLGTLPADKSDVPLSDTARTLS